METIAICPRCGNEVEWDWYCSEGYCSHCCIATDTHEDEELDDPT